MKIAHKDEAYDWMPSNATGVDERFPKQYAAIPDELFERLKIAWNIVSAVCEEIDEYKKANPTEKVEVEGA